MKVSYENVYGGAVDSRKGYCEIRYTYDESGKQQSVTYWTTDFVEVDQNGQPVLKEEPAA